VRPTAKHDALSTPPSFPPLRYQNRPSPLPPHFAHHHVTRQNPIPKPHTSDFTTQRQSYRAMKILDLGTRWRRKFSFTPLAIYPRGSNPRCALYWRVGRLQSRSGWCEVDKKSCLCRKSNPGPPTCSLSLYRLSYPGYGVITVS
jgi:hypothetical protein